MSRWSLVFVAVWALGLTIRGPQTAPATPAAPLPDVAAAPAEAAAPAPAMDSAAVARIVGGWNPGLSEVERVRIGDAVMRCVDQHGLDPTLVTGVMWVESRAKPWARSPKGAMGLMQVMPYMAEQLGLAGNFTNIESNIAAGCMILSDNITRLGEADGVSAYFWGSKIRNAKYRDKVEAARERVRNELSS